MFELLLFDSIFAANELFNPGCSGTYSTCTLCYALSQWTECKLSLDECSNCEFYPVCVGRLCPNAVLEGNTECRFNKQAVYRHIELVADMLYNKRMLNQPK